MVVAWADKGFEVAKWVVGVCEPCRRAHKVQQQGLSVSLAVLYFMDNTVCLPSWI